MINPRQHLKDIYRMPDDPESHLPYLRLDKNERIVPFSQRVWERFRELLTPEAVMAYPELEALYHQLAMHIGVERDNLFFATGSDLAIKTVYETFIDPGDTIQIHIPGYAMYEVYGKIFQARVNAISYENTLRLDVDAYIDAINQNTRMVVVENPNGFIGTHHSIDVIRAIVKKAQQCGAFVLIDEAYYLFSNQTIQPLYQEFDNVIIVRSFSKDLGIAGLRCGYLLSQKENIQSIFRVKPMHEINSAAVAFSQALLESPHEINEYVGEVQQGIRYVKQALEQLGLVVRGGSGNFVVIYLGLDIDSAAIINYLKSRNILIRRPFTAENLKGWLRVGMGAEVQMTQFVTVFAEALEAAGWRRDRYNPPVVEI